MAVNVGAPDIFTNTETKREVSPTPARMLVEKASVQTRQLRGKAEIILHADIRDEHACTQGERTIAVKRQKRLAFGFFPDAAELVFMPDGALSSALAIYGNGYRAKPRYVAYYENAKPSLWRYAVEQSWRVPLCFPAVMSTLNSLFFAPFAEWGCGEHDFLDLDHYRLDVEYMGKIRADASASPKLQALAGFPKDVRKQIGIGTCFEVAAVNASGLKSHFGLVGFHKYLAVSVEIPEQWNVVGSGVESRYRKSEVSGPYEMELSIPGLGHSERKVVPAGESRAWFDLPAVPRDGLFEAFVAVRECRGPDGGECPELTRDAIQKLAGQANRVELVLHAKENAEWIGAGNGSNGYSRGRIAGDAGADAIPDYEILGIKPSPGGLYAVRARLGNPESRAAVVREIEEEVRRRVREDYAHRHPETRAEEIRDRIECSSPDGTGTILEFTGWAFGAHPLAQGWHYDAERREGEIRVLISAGLPEEQAVQWARENIVGILADKMSALPAEAVPAEGADFECTGTHYGNGILCIEFRATGRGAE